MTRNGWLRVLPLVLAVVGPGCYGKDDCQECVCDAGTGDQAAGAGGAGGTGGQESPGAGSGGADAGSGGADAGQGGEAGTPAGTLLEGYRCSQQSDCWSGLSCVIGEAGLYNICARICAVDTDCDEGEECITAGRGGEPFCSLRMEEDYDLCGEAYTRHCSDSMQCMYVEALGGVCVVFCDLATEGQDQCRDDQVCAGGILSSDTEGVCGAMKGRGERCDILAGVGCEPENVCLGDLAAPESFLCYQICSADDPTCEQGTCTQLGASDSEYACL